jgi:phage shock protein A
VSVVSRIVAARGTTPMSSLEDLERRIAALEGRIGVEAELRASGDRDLADMAQTLRAQQHTIQALAITQSQHNEKLDRHEESLTGAHRKLDQIITMLDRLLGTDGR